MIRRGAVVVSSCVAALSAACGISALGTFVGDGDLDGGSVDGGATNDGAIIDDATGSFDADVVVPPEPDLPLDPKAACGRPSVYVDDFADGVLSQLFDKAPSGSAREEGGRLVLSYTAGATAFYTAKAAVNFHDDRLRVALAGPPPAGGRAVVSLRGDSMHEIAFVVANGNLTARLADGATALVSQQVNFDPVAHRWLQLVEAGGTTRFETSPDGITWTTITTQPTPSFANVVRPVLSAAAVDAASTPGEVRFARLNAGRPVADWCKMQSFSDDFEDGITSRAWELFQNGACSGAESGGEVRFTMTGAGTSLCGYRSASGYDLSASSAYLDVPAITNYNPPVKFFLRVVDIATGKTVEIGFVGSNDLVENATGIAAASTPYSGSADRWWRVREAGGMLFWESSSNGSTWTVKRNVMAPFAVTSVRVLIGCETDAAMASSISIGTPRFNLGP